MFRGTRIARRKLRRVSSGRGQGPAGPERHSAFGDQPVLALTLAGPGLAVCRDGCAVSDGDARGAAGLTLRAGARADG